MGIAYNGFQFGFATNFFGCAVYFVGALGFGTNLFAGALSPPTERLRDLRDRRDRRDVFRDRWVLRFPEPVRRRLDRRVVRRTRRIFPGQRTFVLREDLRETLLGIIVLF